MEQAFLKDVEVHQGIIHKICRMYCDDPADWEDLFQDILLQLWTAYPTFKGQSKISTWMYRVALNTAITRLRKWKRRPDNHFFSDKDHNISDTASIRIDIEYDEKLQKAINSLNRFDKALVMLYLDEKSYEEMAEIMGISESNIGVKINRIKSKLKAILNI